MSPYLSPVSFRSVVAVVANDIKEIISFGLKLEEMKLAYKDEQKHEHQHWKEQLADGKETKRRVPRSFETGGVPSWSGAILRHGMEMR